jgi:hypothetical protein
MGSQQKAVERLHFVAKQEEQSNRLREAGHGEMQTGHWCCSRRIAEASVGAEIHLHNRQHEPSYLAGIIIGWEPHLPDPRRVVFRFHPDISLIREEHTRWGREKAIVYRNGSAF